jgi:serine/threonine protein kinase
LNESSEKSRSSSGSNPSLQRFGQYELLRKIAAGGMAEIFLAKQTGISGFERMLVIKRILPHLAENKEFITMFLDEARIAAQLNHPNVVQIYDLGRLPTEGQGRHQDSYYIAMEYIHGEDIRKIYNQEVQRSARIPFEYASHIIGQAAAGLDYAHRKVDINGQALGLVHRDISPQNLLVTYDGHIKIVDFGVAKAANKMAQTRSGVLKGKYSYMSPEQAQGMKIDSRTDIFALAVVLYEITCGVRLFKRENELETLHAVIACEVTPPSKLDPGYPAELEKIVMKALSKNPARRYQAAGDFARDLDEYSQSVSKALTARDVAGYMQDLFADKLAEELLVGHGMWEEEHTDDRRAAQQRDERRAAGGTKFLEEEDGEERERSQVTKNDRGSSSRSTPDSEQERSVFDPGFEKSGSKSGSKSKSGSEASSWSNPSNPKTRDTHRDMRQQGDVVEMSAATDALTRMKPFEPMVDMPQTVMSQTEVSARSEAPPADRKMAIGFAIGGSVLLVLLFALVLAGVFDDGERSGPIVFNSRPPGATIYLDGIPLTDGRTPLELSRTIALGFHHVKYQLDGYEPAETQLHVVAGAKNTVELDLKPSAVVPPATPEPDEKPEPLKVEEKKDPPPKVVVKTEQAKQQAKAPGTLTVKSRVPLRIFEGKTLLGTAPLQKTLPAGRHTIRAVHQLSGWSETRTVDVAAGETTRLDFSSGSGYLRVNIQPFGNVQIGTWSAETPIAPVELPVGTYTVKLWNAELNKSETTQVRITDGKETMLERKWK